jgi:hypothetical protein
MANHEARKIDENGEDPQSGVTHSKPAPEGRGGITVVRLTIEMRAKVDALMEELKRMTPSERNEKLKALKGDPGLFAAYRAMRSEKIGMRFGEVGNLRRAASAVDGAIADKLVSDADDFGGRVDGTLGKKTG